MNFVADILKHALLKLQMLIKIYKFCVFCFTKC